MGWGKEKGREREEGDREGEREGEFHKRFGNCSAAESLSVPQERIHSTALHSRVCYE